MKIYDFLSRCMDFYELLWSLMDFYYFYLKYINRTKFNLFAGTLLKSKPPKSIFLDIRTSKITLTTIRLSTLLRIPITVADWMQISFRPIFQKRTKKVIVFTMRTLFRSFDEDEMKKKISSKVLPPLT